MVDHRHELARVALLKGTLGLFSPGGSLPLGVDPAWFSSGIKDLLLVSVDIEAKPDQATSRSELGYTFHCGVSVLDLRSVCEYAQSLSSTRFTPSRSKPKPPQIDSHHFTVGEANKWNRKYLNRANRFANGREDHVLASFTNRIHGILGGRAFILVTHAGFGGDYKHWNSYNIKIRPLWTVDTSHLAQLLYPQDFTRKPSLGLLLYFFRIHHRPSDLHIAGYDALYTLKVLLRMISVIVGHSPLSADQSGSDWAAVQQAVCDIRGFDLNANSEAGTSHPVPSDENQISQFRRGGEIRGGAMPLKLKQQDTNPRFKASASLSTDVGRKIRPPPTQVRRSIRLAMQKAVHSSSQALKSPAGRYHARLLRGKTGSLWVDIRPTAVEQEPIAGGNASAAQAHGPDDLGGVSSQNETMATCPIADKEGTNAAPAAVVPESDQDATEECGGLASNGIDDQWEDLSMASGSAAPSGVHAQTLKTAGAFPRALRLTLRPKRSLTQAGTPRPTYDSREIQLYDANQVAQSSSIVATACSGHPVMKDTAVPGSGAVQRHRYRLTYNDLPSLDDRDSDQAPSAETLTRPTTDIHGQSGPNAPGHVWLAPPGAAVPYLNALPKVGSVHKTKTPEMGLISRLRRQNKLQKRAATAAAPAMSVPTTDQEEPALVSSRLLGPQAETELRGEGDPPTRQ